MSLALDLYPLLRPIYGWIDEVGCNTPKQADVAAYNLRWLLWANFFGPEYVRLLGEDFLSAAPGWRLVEFSDGGLLYVATESFLDWCYADQEEILSHFRAKVPEIQLYRAEPFD